jgi:hypothetical protein
MTAKPDIVERLRELASKATPGEWRWWTSNSWRRLTAHAADGSCERDGDVLCPVVHPIDRHPDCSISEADQEYIAAAHPQAILALLDEITALRKRLEDAEQLVQTHATQQCAAVIRECRAAAERERDEAYERAKLDAERLDWLEVCIRDGSYQTIIHDIAAVCHHAYKVFGNGPALRTTFDGLMATAEDGAVAIRALAKGEK